MKYCTKAVSMHNTFIEEKTIILKGSISWRYIRGNVKKVFSLLQTL
jgi:hypothetical protein